MPLYRCDECGCIENSALGFFHARNIASMCPPGYFGKKLCSEHAPDHYPSGTPNPKGGVWHGKFDKKSATGWYVDGASYIWENPKSPFGSILGRYKEDGTIEEVEITEEVIETQASSEIHTSPPDSLPRYLRRKLMKSKHK